MMALENPKMVTAEAVEAMEFPELADKHGVHGVPHTSINHGHEHVIGAVPELNLLAAIQRVASVN
jgi:hypothetical protein